MMNSWIERHSRPIITVAALLTILRALAEIFNWIRVKELYARIIDPLSINVNLVLWQGLLIIALTLSSRQILKKLSVLINRGTFKNADAVGARLKTRLDYTQQFFQGINKHSIFYVNMWSDFGGDASLKPELWDRYWDCERRRLDSKLTRLLNETKDAMDLHDTETLLNCYHGLCDEMRGYSAGITRFYNAFKDKETSPGFKTWFNTVVDEYNSIVRNIEEDGRYMGELLGKKIRTNVHRTEERMLET